MTYRNSIVQKREAAALWRDSEYVVLQTGSNNNFINRLHRSSCRLLTPERRATQVNRGDVLVTTLEVWAKEQDRHPDRSKVCSICLPNMAPLPGRYKVINVDGEPTLVIANPGENGGVSFTTAKRDLVEQCERRLRRSTCRAEECPIPSRG